MRFLFSSNPDNFARIKQILPDLPYTACGSWGCVVASASFYSGLDPVIAQDAVCVVVADPLCGETESPPDPDDPPKVRASQVRTLSLLRSARKTGLLPHPSHAGTVLVLPTQDPAVGERQAWGITDASGFGSVYYRATPGGGLILGSSPDLVAALHATPMCRTSALELLAVGRVSPPHTLYLGIWEIPAAMRFSFLKGELITQKWWTPPPQQPEMTLKEATVGLEAGIRLFGQMLRAQVSDAGWMTLSAGMDTRYVLALLSGLLDLRTVTTGVEGSPNMFVAAQVAKTLGVPNRAVIRPEGHYCRLAMDLDLGFPSHHDVGSAHYQNGALGADIGPFLIGAYRADVILLRHNDHVARRNAAIAQGLLPEGCPSWFTPLAAQLHPNDVAAISARIEKAGRELGFDEATMASPGFLPLNWQRSSAKGHFDAAAQNYPMYEPFVTRAMCDFSARLPAHRVTPVTTKAEDRKRLYYSGKLAALGKIPVNPTDTPEYAAMLVAIKKALPTELRPRNLMEGGEWAEHRGAFEAPFRVRLAEAEIWVAQTFGIQLPGARYLHNRVIQLKVAWDRNG